MIASTVISQQYGSSDPLLIIHTVQSLKLTHCTSLYFTSYNATTTALLPQQDTGNKLRVKGEGDAAKGAPAGDLYVFISAKSHPTFTRKGADIYADKSVQYLDAILGNDSVRVEIVDGEVEIKVPAGTQPGTIHTILHILYTTLHILYSMYNCSKCARFIVYAYTYYILHCTCYIVVHTRSVYVCVCVYGLHDIAYAYVWHRVCSRCFVTVPRKPNM
jgi:DnaJ C terminal domain